MKNEFVMVPRELDIEGARDFYNEHWTGRCEDLWPQLIEYVKAKSAEQLQGEPVAWIEVADLKEIAKGARWSGTVWGRPADDKGLYKLPPRVPVYIHADLGEVERLREGISKHWKVVCDQRTELDSLRAQLAEVHALLVDIRLSGMDDERCARVDLLLSSGAYANAINKHPLLRTSSDNAAIEVFLSASAEPSTPSLVECDACPRSGGCVNTCMKAPARLEPSAPVELTDEQIIEAMRESLNDADGGYVVDTAPQDVVEAGRALLARAALERKP